MSSKCPMCGDANGSILASLDGTQLARAYADQFGIHTGPPPAPQILLRSCSRCTLRFFDPLWAGNESLYDQLQEHPWYYLQDKDEYEIAARHVGKADRVLEVGAGEGRFAARIEAASYVGLELNAKATARAQQRGVDLRRQTVEDHAVDHADHYDVVCHFQVLEHVTQPRQFLAAGASCLKPGGRLIVSVPNEMSFMGAESNNLLNLPPHHVTRWTAQALRNAGAEIGLEVLAVEYDRLSDLHVKSYARCVAQAALRRWMGRPRRPLDPLFRHPLMRPVVWLLSATMEIGLRSELELRPDGHSVVVVFRRPGTENDV